MIITTIEAATISKSTWSIKIPTNEALIQSEDNLLFTFSQKPTMNKLKNNIKLKDIK